MKPFYCIFICTCVVFCNSIDAMLWTFSFFFRFIMTSGRCCKNSPDAFCYICGKLTYSSERKEISYFIKRAYLAYFGIPLGDQDKPWAPHVICCICYSLLHAWTNKKPNRHLRFRIPMLWCKWSNHNTDCYFSLVETKGFSKKNRHKIKYQSLPIHYIACSKFGSSTRSCFQGTTSTASHTVPYSSTKFWPRHCIVWFRNSDGWPIWS